MAKNEEGEDRNLHKKKAKREGNVYDHIFKENFEASFIPLVKVQLGIEIVTYQKLPTEFPKTVARNVDFLAQVTTKQGEELILQVEFQTKDDPTMLKRMRTYHSLLLENYDKPIEQMVVYLGKQPSKMRTTSPPNKVFRGFSLLSLHQLDPDSFLASDTPEVLLLALLTNYEQEQSEAVLRSIVEKLTRNCEPLALQKYLRQLLTLSSVRQLEELTLKTIENMPIDYNIEDSTIFKRGEQKRMDQVLLALKCLKEGKSHEETALISGLTIEEVKALDLQD